MCKLGARSLHTSDECLQVGHRSIGFIVQLPEGVQSRDWQSARARSRASIREGLTIITWNGVPENASVAARLEFLHDHRLQQVFAELAGSRRSKKTLWLRKPSQRLFGLFKFAQRGLWI